MTEAEWLSCTTRPAAMFRHVRAKAGRRKLQLLSCVCCRVVWDHIPDERLRAAVVAAERYADGEIEEDEFTRARQAACPATRDVPSAALTAVLSHRSIHWEVGPGDTVANAVISYDVRFGLERAVQWVDEVTRNGRPSRGRVLPGRNWEVAGRLCDLFREIIGNPFRPWAVPAGYPAGGLVQPDGRRVPVTAAVHDLAAGIQADQAFDRLPVLADAAEDAGVTDPALLDHLRHGSGHVRGCWALGVLLGKA